MEELREKSSSKERFNEQFVKFLTESSQYDITPIPNRNDEDAFLAHLNMSLSAACVCNLNAIKYLAGLLVTDKELSAYQNLFQEFAKIMKALRDNQVALFNRLSKIAMNEENIYSEELMNFAKATLKEFIDRKYINELLSNAIVDDFVVVDEDDTQTPLHPDIITSFALAKLAGEIQKYLDTHLIKPEALLHINAVLNAIGNTSQDIYGVILADYIAPQIKIILESALNSQVPSFKKTKDQYRDLIEILTAEITQLEDSPADQQQGDRSATLTRSNSFVGNIGELTSGEELTRFTNPLNNSN